MPARTLFNDILNNVVAFRIGMALMVLIAIFAAGSVGYHLLEDMTLFEGFYMTFITITTIGFGEIHSLTIKGRLLTVGISLVGIGVIAYIASQGTQLLFESEIFRTRAMKKTLEKMENHYIICGYGRIGHRIAQVLYDANIPIVVVENRPDVIERVNADRLLYVEGNAQEEDVLRRAGIERAQGLVCTLSRDQDNVFVTLIARELNERIFILVRTNQHRNTRKILRAGANKVISPYEIGADRMANVILRPHVDHFMDRILGGSTQDHVFDEAKIFPDSDLDGKTLSEASIRQKYFVVIIAIIPKESRKIVFNPGSDDKIQAGDSLIVLGDIDRISHLRSRGCNDHRTLAERVSDHNFLEFINFNRQTLSNKQSSDT